MQDRWADNTGTDVRQSGGIPSEQIWAPTTNAEEQARQGLRTAGGPPSDFELHQDNA